jgi:hypothetical protein
MRVAQKGNHLVYGIAINHLLAFGSGVDMAMNALLIASVPQIHLKRFERASANRREIRGF